MPLIETSGYKPHPLLFNPHLETVYPNIFRKTPLIPYSRQRLELADGDFLDLDWLSDRRDKVIILSHGLEGSSKRHYCKGMAHYFFARGWDVLAWNCRSCSGELNRLARFYHHGDTIDFAFVIEEALKRNYGTIALAGFSMGGSFSLKYLGEQGENIRPEIKCAAVFSVPCDLGGSARELDQPARGFYRKRFLKKLEVKMRAKSLLFPEHISMKDFDSIKSFDDFNDIYTASLHGFKNGADFYEKNSANAYLKNIHVPALIVNAKNDPLLSPSCSPLDLVKTHPFVYLEMPDRGGHVGFTTSGPDNWMDVRAFEFISEHSQ